MGFREKKASYWQDAPQPRDQIVLFAETLEDRIPSNHPVRLVDEILTQFDWSAWESRYDGGKGQPPIHPSVLCKVLLFGTIRGITSSRQLAYQVKHSIDFIWLASGRTFDHSTLCKFRTKHGAEVKELYRDLVKCAIDLGVAKISEVCIDGTRVLANANRYRTLNVHQAKKLLDQLETEFEEALSQIQANDHQDDLFDDGQPNDQLPSHLSNRKLRIEAVKTQIQKLDQMEVTRKSWVKDPIKNPAQLPITDNDARILPNKGNTGYSPNYTPMVSTTTDSGMIVDSDVVIGNVEHKQLIDMVDRVTENFAVEVETVYGDKAYATGENLTSMEQAGVEVIAPMAEVVCVDNAAIRDDLAQPVAPEDVDRLPKNPQTKRFDKTAFVFVEDENAFYCPEGKPLEFKKEVQRTRGQTKLPLNQYTCDRCAGCPKAAQCRTNPEAKQGRTIYTDPHEPARRRHRERMSTEESKERYKKRQHFGETPFGVIKHCFGTRQFRLRGIEKVRIEWNWNVAGFNLRRLLTLIMQKPTESKTEVELAPC